MARNGGKNSGSKARGKASRLEASKPAVLSPEQQRELFYYVTLNRRLEERLRNLYRNGKVVGGLYRSLGQEGLSCAAAYALEDGDFLGPMIRNLGAILVRGIKPRLVIGQYMARAIGPTGGRDCNTHMGDMDLGIVACISMVASLVPVMAGVALHFKLAKSDRVAMTFVGDGSTGTGEFHEGANFAAVKKLPLIMVVEANGYAYSTPTSEGIPVQRLADRAKGYGIAALACDGNNVFDTYTTAREAIALCRAGKGPVIIEAETFRMLGHAEHDDASYVPKDLLESWAKRDPLDRFRARLLRDKVLGKDELEALEARIVAELDEEVAAVEASPFPAPSFATGGVYAEEPRPNPLG